MFAGTAVPRLTKMAWEGIMSLATRNSRYRPGGAMRLLGGIVTVIVPLRTVVFPTCNAHIHSLTRASKADLKGSEEK